MPGWNVDPTIKIIARAEYIYQKWIESPLVRSWLQGEAAAAEARLATAIARLRSSTLIIGSVDLILTLGVPLALWVGVWVAMGAPYAQARALVKNENFISGFSQGFVMGLLKWKWHQVVSRFGKFAPDFNAADSSLGYVAANARNEGLRTGFVHASLLDDKARRSILEKLKMLSPSTKAGNWSRLDQISYVIELAAAGRRNFIFRA